MNMSGMVSGLLLSILGIVGAVAGFFLEIGEGGLALVISGLIFACTGIYMLLNAEKEDEIEQIRANNKYAEVLEQA